VQRLNLTFRFLIPVGAVLALTMAPLIWTVGEAQGRRMEQAFQEQLATLAVASRTMIHSAAADYCRTRGMVFHRIVPGQPEAPGPAAEFERTALDAFRRDPSLTSLSRQYRDPDGTPRLFVLAPAKLQRECGSCHAASGMTAFLGRPEGELVGAFGVSADTGPLHRSVARTRLLAALVGLGAWCVVALVAAYFVRRSILGPLEALSAAITRMAQGDLTARTPVRNHDEIGRLGETFNHMVAQLHQANQDYMEVLAFVSHELKHPLAAMITDARVLADGYLGPVEPAQAQKLVRLMAVGARLLELVEEYLDLARIEGGNLALKPRDAALPEEVVEPAVEMVTPQAQVRGMTLERVYPEGLGPVQCDPHLLKIVLVNLLGNAVKYGRDGALVRLKVEALPDRVRIAVWNQGPGFPPLERARLFRKFSRLRDPELMARKGTGIGLYTAWHIVQLHGGTMDARSEQGAWAEFSLEIPQPLPGEGSRVSAEEDFRKLGELPALDG